MTGESIDPRQRQTLGALRYAVNEDATTYLAIMRLFTSGMSGFLSDQSADDVTERLAELGLVIDRDTVDLRLSYLVEHGNLARSPRETEARSVRDYLSNRARYQLTPRGELVHRQVEELLAHTDRVREVSSEMLPGILAGIEELARLASQGLEAADSRDVAGRITTLFAQFEVLVSSTRQFYSYLTQVLTRFDLGRDEFVMFKGALIDYLQRFVDEISRHMPQVGDRLGHLEKLVPALCARANADERLVGLDGVQARRATGLEAGDWESLHAWFVGSHDRRSDAENVRRLATDAMRSLLTNLRRIAAGADRQQSQYADLIRLARWFDSADDDRAHEIWAAAFGLYSARHLSFAADPDGDPVPATQSWWIAPVAEVPIGLRTHGERKTGGRAGARVDYSAAKQARLAEREQEQRRRTDAVRELASHAGPLIEVRLSDDARAALLDLYAQALSRHSRPLSTKTPTWCEARVDDAVLRLELRAAPGTSVSIKSPSGILTLRDLAFDLTTTSADQQSAVMAERRAEA
ncbi:TIGR02677 family protein [Arthrobacter sp. ISL-28]|uniref:TIGR02677 family protein n=1 Tax=Arthrobacter sp. ISL-28 TaxID=2819108 RepID=UPI001BE5FA69|nr:TIGR02677 family protein [Arthrobacter sp. ISL-28]MBT2521821.1 TIGR02677 family protein [Arthrobacter sp. ISL-28]